MNVRAKCVESVMFNSFTIGKVYHATITSDDVIITDDDGDECGIVHERFAMCFVTLNSKES